MLYKNRSLNICPQMFANSNKFINKLRSELKTINFRVARGPILVICIFREMYNYVSERCE